MNRDGQFNSKNISQSAAIKNFAKAIDALKNDYSCGVCKELCKNPVTLSKCFHIVCADHFEGLKSCPECGIDLEGCTTYIEKNLSSTIESTKELDAMLVSMREEHALNQKGKNSNKKKTSDNSDLGREHPINNQVPTLKPKISKTGKFPGNTSLDCNAVEKRNKEENIGKTPKPEAMNSKNYKVAANISLLSNSSKIEKKNNKGETLLHIACRIGKIERIVNLLDQGANVNTKDNAGWTPLHEVVQNNRLDIVELLLQHNALINVPGPSNETPLHEAVRYKHEDIIVELVKNGADMHIRNCKGETPYQLAYGNMKDLLILAAGEIVQTQGVNISRISTLYTEQDFEDIHILCITESRSVLAKLKILVKHHSNVQIEAKFTKHVTHLIVDVEDNNCLSSVDVLQGVVSSLWLLSTEWVTKSTQQKLEPFEDYEVTIGPEGCKGPKTSRYNKYQQLPGLFNGCHFYLHNFTNTYEISKSLIITKSILSKLITDAGGVVLRRVPNPESIPENEKLVPYHAEKGGKLVNCSHYIIFRDVYEPMYNMQHIKALPVAWLINCLEKYELCNP